MSDVLASGDVLSIWVFESVGALAYNLINDVWPFPCWSHFSGVWFLCVGEDLSEDPVADGEGSDPYVLVVAPCYLLLVCCQASSGLVPVLIDSV